MQLECRLAYRFRNNYQTHQPSVALDDIKNLAYGDVLAVFFDIYRVNLSLILQVQS